MYQQNEGLKLFARMFDAWYQIKSLEHIEDDKFEDIIKKSFFESDDNK